MTNINYITDTRTTSSGLQIGITDADRMIGIKLDMIVLGYAETYQRLMRTILQQLTAPYLLQ